MGKSRNGRKRAVLPLFLTNLARGGPKTVENGRIRVKKGQILLNFLGKLMMFFSKKRVFFDYFGRWSKSWVSGEFQKSWLRLKIMVKIKNVVILGKKRHFSDFFSLFSINLKEIATFLEIGQKGVKLEGQVWSKNRLFSGFFVFLINFFLLFFLKIIEKVNFFKFMETQWVFFYVLDLPF